MELRKTHRWKRLNPSPSTKVNKSCGCKGDCSTRRCGCVKNNNKCIRSCRCSNTLCSNQASKKENVNIISKPQRNSKSLRRLVKQQASFKEGVAKSVQNAAPKEVVKLNSITHEEELLIKDTTSKSNEEPVEINEWPPEELNNSKISSEVVANSFSDSETRDSKKPSQSHIFVKIPSISGNRHPEHPRASIDTVKRKLFVD